MPCYHPILQSLGFRSFGLLFERVALGRAMQNPEDWSTEMWENSIQQKMGSCDYWPRHCFVAFKLLQD